jgi:hypothetical protein
MTPAEMNSPYLKYGHRLTVYQPFNLGKKRTLNPILLSKGLLSSIHLASYPLFHSNNSSSYPLSLSLAGDLFTLPADRDLHLSLPPSLHEQLSTY